MKETFTVIMYAAGLFVLYLVIKNWNKIFPQSGSASDSTNNALESLARSISSKKTTCELRDANGNVVTISGSSDDPQFQKMCSIQPEAPVYVYGYPYTFSRRRGHHGGHHGGEDE